MTKDSDRTSSQADFLANLSVSQEKENLRKMTEISGRKLLGLSKSPDPLFLLEKMLMESLNSISTPYLRTWKVQTTPRGALIFQLRASVRTTKDKESGLLPTPTQDSASERTKKYKQGGTPLTVAVQMYPTPNTRDTRRGCNQKQLATEIDKEYPKAKKTGGRLNPNFVERLMGFPTDWTKIDQTESKDSETQSFHKSHTTSDKS